MTDLFKILAALISVALPAIGSGYAMEKSVDCPNDPYPKQRRAFSRTVYLFGLGGNANNIWPCGGRDDPYFGEEH